jgi:hypothetical protein
VDSRLGWLLATIFTIATWQAYGLHGLAFAAGAIVFWLLLTLTRALRVMRIAGQVPVGRIDNAVMFHAGLARGMTMLQVVGRTKSLGSKVVGSEDDWRWSDGGGAGVVLHFERGRLASSRIERPGDPTPRMDPS